MKMNIFNADFVDLGLCSSKYLEDLARCMLRRFADRGGGNNAQNLLQSSTLIVLMFVCIAVFICIVMRWSAPVFCFTGVLLRPELLSRQIFLAANENVRL